MYVCIEKIFWKNSVNLMGVLIVTVIECKWKCQLLTCVQLFPTPWTVSHQAPLSIGFSREDILKWVAISSRGSSQPRDWTWVSRTTLPLLGEPHYRPLLYHEPPGRVGVHKIYSTKHLIIISEHSNTLFLTTRFLSSSPLLCVVGLKIQHIMRKPRNV